MAEPQEQRRTPRAKIAGRLTGRATVTIDSDLLDLSATGAHIEHLDPLPPGTVCTFELPPALGSLVLSARVVRTRVSGSQEKPGGGQRRRHESGLEFINITAEQQAALDQIL